MPSTHTGFLKMPTLYLEAERNADQLKIGAYEANAVIWRYEGRNLAIGDIEARCRRITETLNRASRRSNSCASAYNELMAQGESLAQAFLPGLLRQKLSASDAEYLIFRIDDRLVQIPWELIAINGQFLCQRFSTGRLVKTHQEIEKIPPRALNRPLQFWIVANPKGDLSVADDEGSAVFDAMESLNQESKTHVITPVQDTLITPAEMAEHIKDYDMLHYAGHARYQAGKPRQSGWELAGGDFTAAHVDQMAGGIAMPALIFSNACQSARTDEWKRYAFTETASFGLANAFLRAGARHYIGTAWEITDTAASRFAESFYHGIKTGKPVGKAIQESRQALIREKPDIGFMSYVLYGDPRVSYFSQKHRQAAKAPASQPAHPPEAVVRGSRFPGNWLGGFRFNPERLNQLTSLLVLSLFLAITLSGIGLGWAYHRDYRETLKIKRLREQAEITRNLREAAEKTEKKVRGLWKEFKGLCPEIAPPLSPTLAVVLGPGSLAKADQWILLHALQERLLYRQHIFKLVERQSFDQLLQSLVRQLNTQPPDQRECALKMPSHLMIVERFSSPGSKASPVLMRLVEIRTSRILIAHFAKADPGRSVLEQKESLIKGFMEKLSNNQNAIEKRFMTNR